jgi:CheY-like chemotaxis protein
MGFVRFHNVVVLGGSLLPDGRVALVLNPDYLLTKAVGQLQPDSEAALAQTRTSAVAKRRVLYAEDSGTLRALGKSLLEHVGFDVQAAADGQEALELWKRNGADVVVTDLEMPVMDGLALIRAIRAAGSSVKIAALSADDTAEKRIAATEAGANAYLVKGASLKRQLVELLASEN